MSLTVQDRTVALRDRDAVHGYVEKVCFKTGPPGLVGTELEWILAARGRPGETIPLERLQSLLGTAPLARGTLITFEPGGQVELSSAPLRGPSACWDALAEDAAHVRAVLDAADIVVLPTALDPWRPPHRQLRLPRYDAMARYFDDGGHEQGAAMMNSTAATQVNLDIGRDRAEAARRWHLLHAVGPALVAAFANSPMHDGRPTGWRCGRQRVWQGLDPERTVAPAGADPVAAYTDFLLDATVMLRPSDGPDWCAPPGLRFADRVGSAEGATGEELDLHLSTLFPPVRPRGWFEVRYVDALPNAWWPVPMAVLWALVEDAEATEEALIVSRDLTDWAGAARDGLASPGLHDAARALFDLALAALARSDEDAGLVGLVADYADRYVRPGRCPADDPIPEDL